jgi:hypothetical protein
MLSTDEFWETAKWGQDSILPCGHSENYCVKTDVSILEGITRYGQNNGNTKKLRNKIYLC